MYVVETDKGGIGRVEGRNIVISYGVGKWGPEDVHFLTNELLKLAQSFGSAKWAYIADPMRMDPIMSKETSQAFIELHTKLEAAGCVAIAFVDGKTAAMKLQSQKHQDKSSTKMVTTHIKSEQEALDWLKDSGL